MATEKKKISFNPITGSFDVIVDVSDLAETADLADYVPVSEKAAPNGVATLNGSGLIPNEQLPNLSITDTFVVASEAAMLALTSAEKGDVAVRTDLSKTFILKGDDYSVLSDWQELLTPTDSVLSVNGQTGVVSLDSDDIPEGDTNIYFTDSLAKAATISQNITDGVTDFAPSEDTVFDALQNKVNTLLNNISGFTNGAILYVSSNSLVQSIANLFFDSATNRLGLGTQSPVRKVHIVSEDSSVNLGDGINLDYYNNTATNSVSVVARRSRGTVSSPSAVQSGDNVLVVAANGHDGTSFQSSPTALMSFVATENYTPTSVGTKLRVATVPNGSSVSGRRVRFEVDQDGGVVLYGNTSGNVKLLPSSTTTNHTLTLPAAQGSENQVLKNDGSGTLSWTNISDIGGVKNFILNSSADVGTSGWSTYADAAAARPVDGTGGSPNITWTRSTSSPLSGVASFLFTKDAANRQGEGVSYAFTIDSKDQAKVLQISFDYIVSSGTFTAGTSSTDSDIIVYLYDVSNATLIEPSSIKLLSNSTTIADRFTASFQTPSNSTSFRLLFHCATTSTSSYVVKIDNVQVSPTQYAYGTPITDWQSYTPTINGAGTPTNVNFIWRRVGDSIQIRGLFTTGTVAASAAYFTIPSGLSIDTNKISSASGNFFGDAVRLNAGASTRKRFKLLAFNGSTNIVYFTSDDYTAAVSPASTVLGNSAWSNSETQSVQLENLPIQGWSSSVQMSDQTDTRIVGFWGNKTSSEAVTANTTNITYATQKDTHGGWSGNVYTVPVAGDYYVGVTGASNSNTNLEVYVNGSSARGIGAFNNTFNAGNSTVIYNLKTGDTITIRANSSVTINGAGNSVNTLNIFRISGPNQIAASEAVYAQASGNPASATSGNPIIFPTTDMDSHGGYSTSTGRYTVAISGTYRVAGHVQGTPASGYSLYIYKNAVQGSLISSVGTSDLGGTFTGLVRANAGDILDIRPNNTIDVTGGVLNFERIGL